MLVTLNEYLLQVKECCDSELFRSLSFIGRIKKIKEIVTFDSLLPSSVSEFITMPFFKAYNQCTVYTNPSHPDVLFFLWTYKFITDHYADTDHPESADSYLASLFPMDEKTIQSLFQTSMMTEDLSDVQLGFEELLRTLDHVPLSLPDTNKQNYQEMLSIVESDNEKIKTEVVSINVQLDEFTSNIHEMHFLFQELKNFSKQHPSLSAEEIHLKALNFTSSFKTFSSRTSVR